MQPNTALVPFQEDPLTLWTQDKPLTVNTLIQFMGESVDQNRRPNEMQKIQELGQKLVSLFEEYQEMSKTCEELKLQVSQLKASQRQREDNAQKDIQAESDLLCKDLRTITDQRFQKIFGDLEARYETWIKVIQKRALYGEDQIHLSNPRLESMRGLQERIDNIQRILSQSNSNLKIAEKNLTNAKSISESI